MHKFLKEKNQIAALERARKVEELQTRIGDIEGEKSNLLTQLASYKTRARSAVECSNDRNRRDEQTIHVNCYDYMVGRAVNYCAISLEFKGRTVKDEGTTFRFKSSIVSTASISKFCGSFITSSRYSTCWNFATASNVMQCPSGIMTSSFNRKSEN